MTLQTIQNNLSRIRKNISNLEKQLANESKKEADCFKHIQRIQKSITKNTSISLLSSKTREIQRKEQQLVKIKGVIATLRKKMSTNSNELSKYDQKWQKEQIRLNEASKRTRSQFVKQQQAIQSSLEQKVSVPHINGQQGSLVDTNYDFFISHASEDKEDVVRPLTLLLENSGYSVWYDEFRLKVGDSLRETIDIGINLHDMR